MMTKQALSTIWMISGFVMMIFFTSPVNAQSIRTHLDKKEILIGEQIHYRLQFVLPSTGYQVEFNVPDSLPHFEILQKSLSDSSDQEGNILKTQHIIFTSWDSGQWTLPAIPMKIRTLGNQAVYSLNADPVTIKVGYMAIDSTGVPRDIKTVMNVSYVNRDWIWIVGGILLGLIIAYLLYRYIRRRPKKTAPSFKSDINAFDEAMQGLRNLKDRQLSLPEETKKYYTELTHIFSYYLSRRQQKNLLNQTSSELLMLLHTKSLEREMVSETAATLRTADAVKFAKYQPDLRENRGHVQQMEACIVALEKIYTDKN